MNKKSHLNLFMAFILSLSLFTSPFIRTYATENDTGIFTEEFTTLEKEKNSD